MMTRTRFLQDRSCADVPISLGPGAVAGAKRELSADSLRAGMTGPIVSRADTPGMKAARRLAAITTPFLEIPGNIVETSKSEGQLAGWTTGLAKGSA